ncbi:hypothetical protein GC194_03935 [bacterium]|nr:hypothetical protein [bacterium]
MSLLLTGGSAMAQLLGGEIYPSRINGDTFTIEVGSYYECDESPAFNDTLRIDLTFSSGGHINIETNPFQISYDTLISDCSRCSCAAATCSFHHIIYRQSSYTINLAQLGFTTVCDIKAKAAPAKRIKGLKYISAADEKMLHLSTEIKNCNLSGELKYDFAVKPSFVAIKGQYYLQSQGFEQNFENGIGQVDSIVATLEKPQKRYGHDINYNSGYNHNNPLDYNGYPNTNNAFPRGFHLVSETGDLRFSPTNEGKTLIKTRFSAHHNGKLTITAEREFCLETVSQSGENSPYLTGKNFSSFINIKNFSVYNCFYTKKTTHYKAIDLNNTYQTKIKLHINKGLNKYITATYRNDSLHITSNFDALRLGDNPLRIQVELLDSSCVAGATCSYTILFYNYEIPKASPVVRFGSNRMVNFHAADHDGYNALNYLWKFNGKTLIAKDTSAQVKTPGSYKFKLITFGLRGCNDTFVGTYNTPPFPYVVINTTGKSFCQYDSVLLVANYFNATNAPDFEWNGQKLSSIFDLILTGDTTIVVNAQFDDSTENSDTILIKAKPNPTPHIFKSNMHCRGNQLKLSALPDSANQNTIENAAWFFNGKFLSDSLKTSLRGEGQIDLHLSYRNGCVNSTSTSANYTIDYSTGKYTNKSCPQQPVLIEVNAKDGFAYHWYLNDSLVHSTSNIYNLERASKNDTLVMVASYTTNEVNCRFEDTIHLQILPIAPFSVVGDTVFCANDTAVNVWNETFVQPASGYWTDNNSGKKALSDSFFNPAVLAPTRESYRLQYTTVHPISSCKYTRDVTFKVLPVLEPQFVVDSIKLCIGGDEVMLNSANYATPSNGDWVGNGTYLLDNEHYFSPSLVGINSTNIISYIYTGPNGCVSRTPVIVTVNLKPNPYAKVRSSTAPRTIDFYDQRDPSDCSVDKWFWDFYDVYSQPCTLKVVGDYPEEIYCRYAICQNPVHRYTKSGIYPVKLVVEDSKTGIKDSIIKYNYIFLLASSSHENTFSGVSIYPNPSNGLLHINQNYDMPIAAYAIRNALGQILQQGSLTNIDETIAFNPVPDGFVILELINKNGEHVFTKTVLVY